jgi:hypothetical protein
LPAATAFVGDVSGVYSATSVDKIKGTGVSVTALGTGNFLRYDGTNWVNTNLSSGDVTTGLGYTPVNKAGDTMTGLLVLSADPSTNLGAATKQYIDSSTATAASNAQTYTDTKFITKTLPAAPTVTQNGQSIRWNNGSNIWEYYTPGTGSGDFMKDGSVAMTGALANNTNSASSAIAVTQSGAGPAATFMGGNVGIGTTNPQVNSKLQVNGVATSLPNIINSGASIDLSLSNIHYLKSVGGAAVTLSNIANGGSYTVVISDTIQRTYTFAGCTNSYFSPVNGDTIDRSTYSIMTIVDGGSTECYITWVTGYAP